MLYSNWYNYKYMLIDFSVITYESQKQINSKPFSLSQGKSGRDFKEVWLFSGRSIENGFD